MGSNKGVTRRGIRVLGRYVRAHPVPFWISIVGAVLGSFAAVASTVVAARVTDEVVRPALDEGVTTGRALGGAGVILLAGVLRSVGVMVRRYWAGLMEARMQVTLRRAVLDQYLDVPVAFHRERPTGELLAHADADVVSATNVLRPLPMSVGVVALLLFALASLALVDLWFAAIALVLFPALTVLNRFYTARVEEPTARVQEKMAEVSSIAHESFDGAMVVKLLGRRDAEVERMRRAAESLRDERVQVGRLRSLFEPLLDALPGLATIAMVLVGAWRLSAGAVTAGEIVQGMLLFSMLGWPMRVVGFLLEEIPRSVISLERVDRVLEASPERAIEPGTGVSLPPGPLSLALRDVSFAYGSTGVLERISLEVEPGESVALVGATGSGKSTICDLLLGLSQPDAGAVAVGGLELGVIDPLELRRAVALVFQETFLFAASVRDNLLLDHPATEDQLAEALRLARADGFVARLPEGLDTPIGERGVTLSGGQRQRIALARALLRRPRALLLDDATSAVDPVIEAEILDGLRSQEATVLVVAHRLATIRLADRVLYLEEGRISATGPHSELLEVPGYRALVRAYEDEVERGDAA